ncbi:hypothetical protein [Neisseria yangbaofengii]|uniref:hypothetical protein n=1 Tax=Neisseria yangbaofengii TaxID=2709396 RepID=UPI0013ED578F|nr:hypothetical protein [Neisseria yangbaofengii]
MSDLLFKSRVVGFRKYVGGRRNAVLNGKPVIFRRLRSNQSFVYRGHIAYGPHYLYGGKGYIAGEAEGIVTVGGQPASRRVYLFVLPSMECIADTWSKPDGSYRFDRLDSEKEYMMVARDYKKQYEPVSYDFIKPYVDSDG